MKPPGNWIYRSSIAYSDSFKSSALDTSTEKDIQKALQNLVQGRSSLSIAHRLSVRIFSNVEIIQLIPLNCQTIASADL